MAIHRYMPPPYGEFLETLSFLGLDVVQWLPVNCAYKDGFTAWHALVLVTTTPIFIFLAVLIATSSRVVAKRATRPGGNSRPAAPRARLRAAPPELSARHSALHAAVPVG